MVDAGAGVAMLVAGGRGAGAERDGDEVRGGLEVAVGVVVAGVVVVTGVVVDAGSLLSPTTLPMPPHRHSSPRTTPTMMRVFRLVRLRRAMFAACWFWNAIDFLWLGVERKRRSRWCSENRMNGAGRFTLRSEKARQE